MSSNRVSAILGPLPRSNRTAATLLERTMRNLVVFADRPDHRRLRRVLGGAFTSRMAERAKPHIARAVDVLLDQLDTGDDVIDLHARLTYPLPAMVMAELLGIPAGDRDAFRTCARDLAHVVGAGQLGVTLAERANRSTAGVYGLMPRLVSERTGVPGEDLLSAMIKAVDDGARLSTDELYANALFLMTAGHETATNMLSNGILTLLRHPDQRDLLLADLSLLTTAVEEMLRYESAVQIAARIADRDREFRGLRLRAGDPVIVLLGAANRDPDVFAEPDRFDITRHPNPHVGFGHGAHVCLGAALARVEMEIVLPRLFDRLGPMRLAEDTIEWQPTVDFRGPTRLLVRR